MVMAMSAVGDFNVSSLTWLLCGLLFPSSFILFWFFFFRRLKVKDLRPPVISLALSPGSGLFMAVLVQMTITGKR